MTKAVGNQLPPRTEVRGLMACTFHVWFSPRRRKAALQGEIDTTVRHFLARIARERQIHLLECETGLDHLHLLMTLPPGLPLPEAMRSLKGASARYLFQRFPELRLDLRHDHFWQRGYGFKSVEPGALASTRSYIRRHRTHADVEPRTLVRGNDSPSQAEPRTSVRGDGIPHPSQRGEASHD